jgi:galactarate dehydratase
VPASELILGMQCGGSDAFSGITANPALGYASDLLLRAGATVMFSEVTEVRDAIYLLTSRAETKEVAEELVREMDWYDRYLAKGEADRSANTTPGNKKGGCRTSSRSPWARSSSPAAARSTACSARASGSSARA